MRAATCSQIKPILKVLHDHFPAELNCVYIIKPDKFWEKQKASLATSKYAFAVELVSLVQLDQFVSPSERIESLDGTLLYNHERWVELRLEIEDFRHRAAYLIATLDRHRKAMHNSQLPPDKNRAERAKSEHEELKTQLDAAIQRIGDRLEEGRYVSAKINGPWFGTTSGRDAGYSAPPTIVASNRDMEGEANHIEQIVGRLESNRTQLLQLWENRRRQLEECLTLRLYEADAQTV